MKHMIAVCNDRGEEVGAQNEKEVHQLGLWHSSSHVWIYTGTGELLFQKRALSKIVYPGLLDISAAGHVQPKENPRATAVRETLEELGVRLDPQSLRPAERVGHAETLRPLGWPNNEFYYLFFYEIAEKSRLAFHPNSREVDSLMFVSIDTVRREILEGNPRPCYTPHGKRYYAKVVAWVESHCGKAK